MLQPFLKVDILKTITYSNPREDGSWKKSIWRCSRALKTQFLAVSHLFSFPKVIFVIGTSWTSATFLKFPIIGNRRPAKTVYWGCEARMRVLVSKLWGEARPPSSQGGNPKPNQVNNTMGSRAKELRRKLRNLKKQQISSCHWPAA